MSKFNNLSKIENNDLVVLPHNNDRLKILEPIPDNYFDRKKAYNHTDPEWIKIRSSFNRAKAKLDPLKRIANSCRRRTSKLLKSKQWRKNCVFKEYIGCELYEFKQHLESKFQIGMNWDNYGFWHIDHIIPLSSANDVNRLYELCHYTNLQPLWAKDNLSKGAKILPCKI